MSSVNTTITYLGQLNGHNGIVTSIVVGKDSNGNPLVVSGGRDKKVIVWKLDLNAQLQEGQTDRVVGKPFKALSGHSHFISGLAITKDSSQVVSSSWDKTLRLWDLNTFKTKALMTGHTKDVLCCGISHDGRLILSGSMDRTLRYWNTKGELKHTETPFEGWVSSITQVKQEKTNFVAVGSHDLQVRLFGSGDQGFLKAISGYDYGVVSTASDDNGEFLFSAEKNGKVKTHKLTGDNAELKNEFDVDADINAICYDTAFYTMIAVATSRGLKVSTIGKNVKTFFEYGVSWSKSKLKDGNERNFEVVNACHALCYDDSRQFLFGGFADGTIRVFTVKNTN